MQITNVEVIAKTRRPSPYSKRDAIQALPGTGSVKVVVTTEAGVQGTGEVSYGRIDGGQRRWLRSLSIRSNRCCSTKP